MRLKNFFKKFFDDINANIEQTVICGKRQPGRWFETIILKFEIVCSFRTYHIIEEMSISIFCDATIYKIVEYVRNKPCLTWLF